jgi:hypothetical protein
MMDDWIKGCFYLFEIVGIYVLYVEMMVLLFKYPSPWDQTIFRYKIPVPREKSI